MRLLIVDDDADFRRMTRRQLAEIDASLEVVDAGCADEATAALAGHPRGHFDLALLDVNMPGVSGVELLRALRHEDEQLPAIFVTATKETHQKVAGLEAGADDWLVKPFDIGELKARIDAVLRRQQVARLEYGDLRVELGRQKASRGGAALDLSPRELELLIALVRAKGDVVTRETLLEQVWELDFDPGTNVIDVQMGRLRRKLDKHGPACVESVRGVGYRLTMSGEAGAEVPEQPAD